jgi:glycosyltransferase involved in cell wall biosynthesis
MSDFLFIASDYKPKPGGIAAYLDSLARGLIALGNTVHVLGLVPPEDSQRLTFLESYAPWVSPFPVVYDKRPKGWFGNGCVSTLEILRCSSPVARRVLDKTSFFQGSVEAISKLEEFVAQNKPRMIVFGHLDIHQYPLVLFLRERGLPYGIIAHDVEVQRFPNKKNDLVRRGMMLKEAAWIAANSRHTKSILEQWNIPAAKIKIVHPPISADAIDASSDTVRSAGRKLQLNIATICRIVRAKGIDIVIRALKVLTERGISCRYVIAGDGSERAILETLTDELGLRRNVQFVGQITESEKWNLLRNTDVFVMSSRVNPQIQHEGFGIAFIEAAAFGVPGVGSRGGGIPDAIVDGETGVLVAEESHLELADALSALYSDPQKMHTMGLVARERARRHFSPTTVADHFRNEVLQVSERGERN